MATDDIYGNKRQYENFKKNIQHLVLPPKERPSQSIWRSGKYTCKNSENLKYFEALCRKFETRDLSYGRRCRLLNSLRLICHATELDLKKCNREDIDAIVRFMHSVYQSPKSKSDFIIDIKHMWKQLFPEMDEKGRVDDTLVPYSVRHLSSRMDKSTERRRKDKLTLEEIERLLQYFAQDPVIQAFIALAVDSLGRPQEILYTKISDVELQDNYAKIWISEHGKEGTGFLQCIDSYPYVARWLNTHPFSQDPNAFLFLNAHKEQLKPNTINQKLKLACRALQIRKPITCYSLKRNGVTMKRLLGYSDVEIQHTARWTSTKQLRTYDLSNQDDTFRLQLIKRGLIQDEKYRHVQPTSKACLFCSHINGMADKVCSNCQRPLDRDKLKPVLTSKLDEQKILEAFKSLVSGSNPEVLKKVVASLTA